MSENPETLPARRAEPLSAPVGHGPMAEVREVAIPAGADPYDGLGEHAFTQAMRDKLLARVDPETMLDVLPDGAVFMPQVHYRRVLNDTFGPGGWGMLPLGPPIKEGKTVCREYALVVGGKTVAVAIGEQDYYPNGRMTYATALEAAKSNALMRCCKDLGIASEAWDRTFTRDFQQKFCVQAYVRDGDNPKPKIQWRRKDAPKLRGETGVFTAGERSTGGAVTKPRRIDEPPPPREPGEDAPTALELQLQASVDATAPLPSDDDLPWPDDAGVVVEPEKPKRGGPPVPFISDGKRRRMLALCRTHRVEVGGKEGAPKPGTLRAALAARGIEHVDEVPDGPIYTAICEWIEGHGG